MRLLAVLFFLLVCPLSSLLPISSDSIFPPNDLWQEDSLFAASAVTEELFNKVIDAGLESFRPAEARKRNERITINRKWTDSTVNANVSRSAKNGGTVTINMYGGLARRPEINVESFAIVLCHELGHAYGGAPYVYAATELSAEGQADYYSTQNCIKRILSQLPSNPEEDTEYEPIVVEKCGQDAMCKNVLRGAKGLASLLATLMGDGEVVDYATPDPYVTPKTMTSYPKTAQCRLDSYFLGWFQLPRPKCWFAD